MHAVGRRFDSDRLHHFSFNFNMLTAVVNIWPDTMMAFSVTRRADNNQIREIVVFSSSIQMMDFKNRAMFVVLTVGAFCFEITKR